MLNPFLRTESQDSAPLTPVETLDLLNQAKAIRAGHFVLTNGEHSDTYFGKERLSLHPKIISRLSREFARRFAGFEPEAVVSPSYGALQLGSWTTYHLVEMLGSDDILSLHTRKDPSSHKQTLIPVLREDIKGRRIIIIDDIATTGGSLQEVMEEVAEAGGILHAAGVVVNRRPDLVNSESLGMHFTSLLDYPTPSYKEDECPQCGLGVPINTNFGHGKEYIERRDRIGTKGNATI